MAWVESNCPSDCGIVWGDDNNSQRPPKPSHNRLGSYSRPRPSLFFKVGFFKKNFDFHCSSTLRDRNVCGQLKADRSVRFCDSGHYALQRSFELSLRCSRFPSESAEGSRSRKGAKTIGRGEGRKRNESFLLSSPLPPSSSCLFLLPGSCRSLLALAWQGTDCYAGFFKFGSVN